MNKSFVRKLKEIYRVVYPDSCTVGCDFENILKSLPKFKSLEKYGGIYVVDFDSGIKIGLRNTVHSDFDVLRQIFIHEEYGAVCSLITLNKLNANINIIDAGANVGYTSVYFSNRMSNCHFFSVEPSRENFEMLKFNIELNSVNAKLYNCALAEVEGKKFEISRGFRDSKDWSICTSERLDGSIDGITINEIVIENNLNYISLLKIDVEGAERFLFKKGVDLSYLKITHYIAIEIHDEFGIRDLINETLKDYGFIIFQIGELTVGINVRVLKILV